MIFIHFHSWRNKVLYVGHVEANTDDAPSRDQGQTLDWKVTSIHCQSPRAMFKLFDCLILPVVSYGHQIWLPFTDTAKEITSNYGANIENCSNSLKQIARDPIEQLHLSILKWTMGLPKMTSNAAVWGGIGGPPLAIKPLKHAIQINSFGMAACIRRTKRS